MSERFEELFRHWKRLVADLVRFGRSEEDAQDLAQEAMLETLKRIDHVQPGYEWPYVRTAARRLAINQATRTKTGDPLQDVRDERPSPEDRVIAEEQRVRFHAAFAAVMADLPEETRKCVVWRMESCSYNEIARRLNSTLAAVQSKLHRANKEFRARLGEAPPGVES